MTEKNFLTKALTDTVLSRRSFLKWSAALGGTAALAGGLKSGLKAIEGASAASEGEWRTAACWHNCNCGNGRCLIKAFVVDGVATRVKTDDTHPDDPFYPQNRACPRGRAQRGQIYAADRLKYPLKRKNWEPGGGKKELRGKDEWVRISWDEALDIVASETKRIVDTYGPKSIFNANWNGGDSASGVFNALGGWTSWVGDTSWGAWPVSELMMDGGLFQSDDYISLLNSKLIVLVGSNWAANKGPHNAYRVQMAREAGAKVIIIDPMHNQTVNALADQWIPVRPTTDTALFLAVAHEMIVNNLQDQEFLDKCTVGFDRSHMPEGADPKENFKDYVLGTYDKTPKTPEWASKICGTHPDMIRQLAWDMGTIKPASIIAGQSTSKFAAGEQWCQVFYTVGWMTGNVGIPGGRVGYIGPNPQGSSPLVYPGAKGDTLPPYPFSYVWSVVPPDITKLDWSAPSGNDIWKSILRGWYGNDKWPGGKRSLDIRMIYNGAANYLNSLPDASAGIEVHRTKVEFVVTANIAMNTAARYADIVLPISTMWERPGELAAGTRETVYWWQNIIEPMYEAKTDYFIGRGLAERLGIDPNLVDNMTDEQRAYNTLAGAMVVKDDGSGYEPLITIGKADIDAMGVTGKPQHGRITLKDLKEQGVYQVRRAPNDVHMLLWHKAFREDPVANPIPTSTGKLEIHSQALANAVNVWGYSEISPIGKWQPSDYMGPEAAKNNPDYPLILFTPHTLRRPHTVMDNVPYLREAFQQECFMSEADATARGLKTGDVALLTSPSGKVIRHVKVLPGMIAGAVALQDGAWIDIDEATGIDRAGSPNILQAFPPSGQGYQTWTGTLLQVAKYDGELLPDMLWPPRRVDFPTESEG